MQSKYRSLAINDQQSKPKAKSCRVQRKLFFQLAPKAILTSRIDFTVLVIQIPQNTSLACKGKLKTEFTSLIAKSTILGLSHTTFFPCCKLTKILMVQSVLHIEELLLLLIN